MTTIKRSKASLVVSVIALLLSVLTVLGIAIGFGNSKITTTKLNVFDFKNGAITEVGKVIESNESAVLKELKTVKDMAIEIDEETATITYKVAFYDEDGKFLCMSEESLSDDFDTTNIPEGATHFNVMITPNAVDGEVVKLDLFNRGKYVEQLKISFARE